MQVLLTTGLLVSLIYFTAECRSEFFAQDEYKSGQNIRIRPVIGNLWDIYTDVEGNYLVPYVLSPRIQNIKPVVSSLINVFDEFASSTCVRFIPRVASSHTDYVTFDVGRRCWSEKGRIGGNQMITVSKRCVLPRYLAVMLIYALGLGKYRDSYFVDTGFDQLEFESSEIELHGEDRGALNTIDVESIVFAYGCFKSTTTKPPTTVQPTPGCGIPVIKPNSILIPKIVGGTEAVPGSYPWQVSIRHRQSDKAFCGASLITDQWVLSAAHCFTYTSNPLFYAAYVGKHNRYKTDIGERRVYFSGVFKHVQYNTKTKEHDIALAKLSSRVQMTNRIATICLPNSLYDVPISGTMLTVTGWGNTKNTGDSNVLRQVNVPLMDHGLCKSLLPPVKSGMICAGYRSGGKDACTGDSGGPLVVKKSAGAYTLVGIVSWGIGCAEKDKPGVYTNVAFYLNWMSGIMANN